MSEQPAELVVRPDAPPSFEQLLGFLAPEPDPGAAGAGGAQDSPSAAGAGQQPAAGEGAGADAAGAGTPAGGDGAVEAAPGAGDPAAADTAGSAAAGDADASGSAARGVGALDALTLVPKFGEIATSFEQKQTEGFEAKAFQELQTEYPKYFEALKKHPRSLVGQKVPSTTGPGEETLRDSEDAKDWQDAVRSLLVGEAESRVEAAKDSARDVFTTVHSSIALFQNNTDLIPGTKQFDRELADAFATAVTDYQVRADGKLVGYSVPVQPIINAIRAQLAGRRAATPSAPAQAALATAQQQRAAEQARTAQGQFTGPQAGIRSQAGQSAPDGSDDAAGLLGAFARQNGFVI